MARDDGQPGLGQLAVKDMKVRAAHAARCDLHQDFTCCRWRSFPLAHRKRRVQTFEHHCAHRDHRDPLPWLAKRSLARSAKASRRRSTLRAPQGMTELATVKTKFLPCAPIKLALFASLTIDRPIGWWKRSTSTSRSTPRRRACVQP